MFSCYDKCSVALWYKHITNTLAQDLLLPLTKISSKTVEGNLHMLADRIFSVSDNKTLSSSESTIEEKKQVLTEFSSGIEFVWLSLYTTDGEFLLWSR